MKKAIVISTILALSVLLILFIFKINKAKDLPSDEIQTRVPYQTFGIRKEYENASYENYYKKTPFELSFYYQSEYLVETNEYRQHPGDYSVDIIDPTCKGFPANRPQGYKCTVKEIYVSRLDDPKVDMVSLIIGFAASQKDSIQPNEFKTAELFGKTVYKGVAGYDPTYTFTAFVEKVQVGDSTYSVVIPYLESDKSTQTLLETLIYKAK